MPAITVLLLLPSTQTVMQHQNEELTCIFKVSDFFFFPSWENRFESPSPPHSANTTELSCNLNIQFKIGAELRVLMKPAHRFSKAFCRFWPESK